MKIISRLNLNGQGHKMVNFCRQPKSSSNHVQLRAKQTTPLLNKYYLNEVTLKGDKIP